MEFGSWAAGLIRTLEEGRGGGRSTLRRSRLEFSLIALLGNRLLFISGRFA
jgi:hypothetical protein